MSDDRGAGLADALAREEEKLLACVHCGFCLSSCPTYVRLGDENDSPRGRLYLMRAVVEGRLPAESDAFAVHIDRCLGCRACEPVCPSGVRYGYLLERAREVSAAARGSSLLARSVLAVMASRPATRVASAAGRLLRSGGLAGWLARRLPRRFPRLRTSLAMLAATRPPRSLAAPSAPAAAGPVAMRPLPLGEEDSALGLPGPDAQQPPGAPLPGAQRRDRAGGGHRIGLLTGCVQEGLFRRVNEATRLVLESSGCEVVPVPAQRCCGALHAHNGALDRARSLAARNVRAFDDADVDYVVVNAAGCGALMKEYGELLAGTAEADTAASVAGRVRDLFELIDELGPPAGGPVPVRATYDAACHLHHGQGVTEAPLRALEAVPGLELVPLANAEECCGGAGIYGMTHPELGGRILADKIEAIRATGAELVLSANPGCIMQIGAGLVLAGERTPVLHPVEVLAASLAAGNAPGPGVEPIRPEP